MSVDIPVNNFDICNFSGNSNKKKKIKIWHGLLTHDGSLWSVLPLIRAHRSFIK